MAQKHDTPPTPATPAQREAHLAQIRAASQAELDRIDRETQAHIKAELNAATQQRPRSEQARIAHL